MCRCLEKSKTMVTWGIWMRIFLKGSKENRWLRPKSWSSKHKLRCTFQSYILGSREIFMIIYIQILEWRVLCFVDTKCRPQWQRWRRFTAALKGQLDKINPYLLQHAALKTVPYHQLMMLLMVCVLSGKIIILINKESCLFHLAGKSLYYTSIYAGRCTTRRQYCRSA